MLIHYEVGRESMGTHAKSSSTNKIFNFDFKFELGAFYPNLALKCYSEARLAKYCLTGASVARLMVKVAPRVEMLLWD